MRHKSACFLIQRNGKTIVGTGTKDRCHVSAPLSIPAHGEIPPPCGKDGKLNSGLSVKASIRLSQ